MQREEIKNLAERQREFFESGASLDVSYRIAALKRLAAAVKAYEDVLTEALYKDLGKSATEAYMCELGLVQSEASYMIKHLPRLVGAHRVHTPIAQFPARSLALPAPYGVTLIMSPWNYPVLLTLDPLIDALAAGNTAVVKPAAYAAHTSEAIASLVGETFPEEYVAVVTGGREENASLLDMRFDMIFFTGSKAVGRTVLEKAAAFVTPVVLELGGKSPCIVDETADIATAARRIVFGKLVNAGQTCVAPDYVLVHESKRDELTESLREEILRQYGPDPAHSEGYCKIINRTHFDRIEALIADAEGRGGKVISIGQDEPGSLRIAPRIIVGASREWDLMQEEIFGPILPILTYRDLRRITREIDEGPSPLALYIFSRSNKHIDYVTRHVRYGGGAVGDTLVHLATPYMGFGGVGESGMGSYHGEAGFDAFSHKKSIMVRGAWPDIALRYRPYTALKDRIIRRFLR